VVALKPRIRAAGSISFMASRNAVVALKRQSQRVEDPLRGEKQERRGGIET